jgi:Ca2+-binding RTX toxin-like protein
VDAGTDQITDLGGADVLVVSAGATANADVTADFVATAASSNDGGLTLNADNVGRFIDMSALGSTNNSGITINGNGGNDNITGTDYNDTISGGLGADVLTGGNGDDIFSYTAVAEGGDTIADYNNATENDVFNFAATGFQVGTSGGVTTAGPGTVGTGNFAKATSWAAFTGAFTVGLTLTLAAGTFAIFFHDTSGTDAGLYYVTGSVATAANAGAAANFNATSVNLIALTGTALTEADIVLV